MREEALKGCLSSSRASYPVSPSHEPARWTYEHFQETQRNIFIPYWTIRIWSTHLFVHEFKNVQTRWILYFTGYDTVVVLGGQGN